MIIYIDQDIVILHKSIYDILDAVYNITWKI